MISISLEDITKLIRLEDIAVSIVLNKLEDVTKLIWLEDVMVSI